MYSNEKTEMNIHRIKARKTGFMPVAFKSVIEMVEPTRKRVNTNSRLEPDTSTLVIETGNK